MSILAGVTGLPTLWLYGAPGVGKTTVTWELFTRLAGSGVPIGYIDIDQLGMCYAPPTAENLWPEPPDDPGRHRLQARALNSVVANFAAAGAQCVIVPGITNTVEGVLADLVPSAELTVCRLRAEPAVLGRRLAGRGGPTDELAQILPYAEALDRAFADDLCIDASDLTVAEVADRVVAQTGWPRLAAGVAPAAAAMAAPPGQILLLCGPTAVGKSAIGWQVYQQVRHAGVAAAFADLDQLGFHRPVPLDDPGNHRLKAANLAAVWREFHAAGARSLIAVGPLQRPEDVLAYHAALPAVTITLVRLHASPPVLTERVLRRGRGISPTWGLAGDELIGQPQDALGELAADAIRISRALDGVGDLCVNVDEPSPGDVAAEILARTGWPSL